MLKDIRRDLGLSAQLNIEASGSGAKRYHIGSKLATLEIGGLFRNAHKFNDGYVLTLTPDSTQLQNSSQFSAGFIPMSTFPNAFTNHNYYKGGNYNLGYQPSFENTFAFSQANPTLFDSSSTQGTDGQEYDLIEKVAAGYVMNSIDISSRWRLIGGLRVESTTENGTNFLFNEVNNTVGPDTIYGLVYYSFAERRAQVRRHSE